MNILMWLKHPGARGVMFSSLYDDPGIVSAAVAKLRAKGWHSDGSMHGIDLRETSLQNTDFSDADLEEADFSSAELQGVNFERTNLTWTNFTAANLENANLRGAILYGANFYEADLNGVDFTDADLRDTVFDAASLEDAIVTPEQLAQCTMLYNTKMPDGSTYDGRYRLEYDLVLAHSGNRDLDSSFDMAEWYMVTMDEYQRGQEWADEYLAALHERIDEQHEQDKLHYQTIEPAPDDPYEEEATYDVEISYSADRPSDYTALLVDSFAAPDEVQAFRRLGWNRDELLEMGAWIATILMWLPTISTALIWLISFVVRLTVSPSQYELQFSLADPRPFTVTMASIIHPIVAMIAVLVGCALTAWSAAQRKASVLTHIAHIAIFAIAWWMPSTPLAFVATIVGFVLAYMTLLTIGTSRGRRLILILAILMLMSEHLPLYQLWFEYVFLPQVRHGFNPFNDEAYGLYLPQVSVTMAFIQLVEATLYVFLMRWGLRSWRTRITGRAHSGTVAQLMLLLYSVLTIARIPFTLTWPLIRDALSL